MGKVVLFTLLLLFILPAGYGQQKKRPVRASGWRTFTPPDKSFSVSLPTAPSKDMPDGFTFGGLMDEASSERYLSAQGSEIYFIGFRHLLQPLDEADRQEVYGKILAPNRRVSAGPYSGVEWSEEISVTGKNLDFAGVRAVCRVFDIENRLFLLAAFVPTVPSLPSKNRRYRANVDKFFSSFKVSELSLIPFLSEPLPDITLKDRNLSSRALDLSLSLPAGWKTEIDHPTDSVSETLTIEHFLDGAAKERRRILFARSPTGLSEFWITVEQPDTANTSLSEFVSKRADLTARTATRHIIGGREFLMIELKTNLMGLEQFTIRRYYTVWNGRILEIGMGYERESDRVLMEDSLKTLATIKRP